MSMDLSQKNIGIAITGSYCTYKKVFAELEKLASTGANLYPIFSDHASTTDSRFGKCADFLEQAEKITGKKPITTIPDAEPIGPGALFDILVIAPCTGNTLSKLANGISDTPVLMAAKAHLRNNRPLVVALSTNDALGAGFKNIGMLMNMKNIYFVPFGQDDCVKKPNSLVCDGKQVVGTINEVMAGRQIQPVIL